MLAEGVEGGVDLGKLGRTCYSHKRMGPGHTCFSIHDASLVLLDPYCHFVFLLANISYPLSTSLDFINQSSCIVVENQLFSLINEDSSPKSGLLFKYVDLSLLLICYDEFMFLSSEACLF